MKAAVYKAPKTIAIEEVDEPKIGPEDVLVRVSACGICGSDLYGYKDGSYIQPGQIMGHEFSGEVVDVGREIKNIKEGDRVTAHPLVYCYECPMCLAGFTYLCLNKFSQSIAYGLPGAFAEFVKIPKAQLNQTVYKLPDEIDYEAGALIEPLATAIHAVQIAEPKMGKDLALIFGAGSIGLFVLQALKNLNPMKIVVSEVSAKRLEVARMLGADAVVNPETCNLSDYMAGAKETFPKGSSHCVDLVIECVGSAATLKQALDIIVPSGRIILVGLGPETPVDITFLVQNEIKMQGAFCFLREFEQAIELIRSKRVITAPLISHKFPLQEITKAFETQLNREESVKVLVVP